MEYGAEGGAGQPSETVGVHRGWSEIVAAEEDAGYGHWTSVAEVCEVDDIHEVDGALRAA